MGLTSRRIVSVLAAAITVATTLSARAEEPSRVDRLRLRMQQPAVTPKTPSPPPSTTRRTTNPRIPLNVGKPPVQPKKVEPVKVDLTDYTTTKAKYAAMEKLLTSMNAIDTNLVGRLVSRSDADRMEQLARQYASYVRQMGGLVEKAQGGPLSDADKKERSTIDDNASVLADEFMAIADRVQEVLERLGY